MAFRDILKEIAAMVLTTQDVGENDAMSFDWVIRLNEYTVDEYCTDKLKVVAPSGFERTGQDDGCIWLRMSDGGRDKFTFERDSETGVISVGEA